MSVERAGNALSDDLVALSRVTEDYAAWDRTYDFMATRDPKYRTLEVGVTTLTGLGVSFIGLFDTNGQTVLTKAIDAGSQSEVEIPPGLMPYLTFAGPVLRHFAAERNVAGIVLLPRGPMRICSSAIRTAEKKGMRGTLVMGQWLDDKQIGSVAQRTRLTLALQRMDWSRREPSLETVGGMAVQTIGPDLVAGYSSIRDLNGLPILMMRVQMPRTIYSQGRVTLVYLILGVVTAGAVFGGVTDLLLHRIVVSRIERLTRNVAAIGIGRHFSARVALPGNDELSTLATSINGMLRLSGAGRGSSGAHQRGARRTYTGEDR